MFSFWTQWGLSQVHQKVDEVEVLSWKMLADGLDCFMAVLGALLVHLAMMALVLESAEGGTFATHHNQVGGGYIVATFAHNWEILGLHRW